MIQGFIQIALTLLILVLIVPWFGNYIAHVFLAQKTILEPIAQPIEKLIYAVGGINDQKSMTGWQYARSVLVSNIVMLVFVFLLLIFQGILPLNPTGLTAPSWDLALHTAVSFVTNTNQQHYSGETTYSYASQMFALGFMM
ncbi:MAG: hypothetical protein RLZZ499_1485, partial [Cyanobacteriota bacterium]